MSVNRRDYLAAAGGALLAAGALPQAVEASNTANGDTLYGHGTVWNRDLPGEAGAVNLSFDLRANLQAGTGGGSAYDPVHPDWNLHYAITALRQEKVRGGESRFTLVGVVTEAIDAAKVGLPVRMVAETRGDGTAIAIAIGDQAFAGAGLLVVIAIIAILIGLLPPAVQKVREADAYPTDAAPIPTSVTA